jgi:hypothetical protein
MANFTTTIRGEGSKGGMIIIPPARLRLPEGWIRVVVEGFPPCFLYARGPAKHTALPVWQFSNLRVGDSIVVEIEPAECYRAKGSTSAFDWNSFVVDDQRTFATEESNGILKLWSRYSAPFTLLRHPPIESAYRMLGFYQAEGSKSAAGQDFSFANANVYLVEFVIRALNEIGIGVNQLHAEILQGVGEDRESAIAQFARLTPKVTAVRPRSGKGKAAYVLHANNSKLFRGLALRALTRIAIEPFPNQEAALAYALGWLDGDATITTHQKHLLLRLAGYATEQAVVLRALTQAFNWREIDIHFGPVDRHTSRCLNVIEAGDLARAGAFPHSMSRARLLLRLREIDSTKIDLVQRDRFFKTLSCLHDEIEALCVLNLPRVHPKGTPYPIYKENGRWLLRQRPSPTVS